MKSRKCRPRSRSSCSARWNRGWCAGWAARRRSRSTFAIVAATNRDLQLALTDGELRDDLYYRLAVVELYLPPLRERAGDIQLLANEFLARFAQENRKTVTGFDDAAMEWILTYSWPGNVRDLKNAVERAVVLATVVR